VRAAGVRVGILCALTFGVLAVCASTSAADEVRLKNGDRITGQVVRLDAGTLAFKSAYGEIAINWSDVAAVTTTSPLVVTVAQAAGRLVTIAPAAEGRVTLREGTTPVAEAALADILSIAPPVPPLVVSGGANAGLLWTQGNTDVSSVHLDAQVIARQPRDRYTFDAFVNRATDRGVETARNASGSARYDRFLTKRLFVGANTIFTNDAFKDLKLRTAAGAGVGYQVWQDARGQLSVDGGLGYVRQNFSASPDVSYAAVREATKLDVSILPRRVDAFHHEDLYIGVTGDDNLFFRMQNGVRVALPAGLVATAQFGLDYDRRPAPGRKSTDRSSAFTFGYKF
jgi:putative salt-induced outer membrane protein YdiY